MEKILEIPWYIWLSLLIICRRVFANTKRSQVFTRPEPKTEPPMERPKRQRESRIERLKSGNQNAN